MTLASSLVADAFESRRCTGLTAPRLSQLTAASEDNSQGSLRANISCHVHAIHPISWGHAVGAWCAASPLTSWGCDLMYLFSLRLARPLLCGPLVCKNDLVDEASRSDLATTCPARSHSARRLAAWQAIRPSRVCVTNLNVAQALRAQGSKPAYACSNAGFVGGQQRALAPCFIAEKARSSTVLVSARKAVSHLSAACRLQSSSL